VEAVWIERGIKVAVYILGHKLNRESLLSAHTQLDTQFRTRLATEVELLQNEVCDVSAHLAQTYELALALARSTSVLEPQNYRQLNYLDVACYTLDTLMTLAASPANEFVCDYGAGEPSVMVRLKGTGTTAYSHARYWIECIFLAVICDRGEVIANLLRIGDETLLSSPTRCPPYMHLAVDAVRSYFKRQPMQKQRAKAALKAAETLLTTNGYSTDVLKVRVAELKMLTALLARDSDYFNFCLEESARIFQDYWSTPERSLDSRGFLSLFNLGLASIACTGGIKLRVSSDYFPDPLVRQEFFA